MGVRKGCGCLGLGSVFVLLLTVALVVGGVVWFAQSAWLLNRITGSDTPAAEGLKIVDWGSVLEGKFRVEVPDELWQEEVAAMFPIDEDVAGFVKLQLRNPRFVPDADPSWLRLELDLVARVSSASNESFPGRAALRTQLKLDRGAKAVVLSGAELVEFTFTGEAGRLVGALQGVLAETFADQLTDFPVFDLPDDPKGIEKTVVDRISGVSVVDHKVVLELGG
jgi:hypothetical protein